MVNGVQYVIMVGLILMHRLFASKWDKILYVSITIINKIIFIVNQLDIKEEYLSLILTMVKVLVVYSLIMYSVLVLRID